MIDSKTLEILELDSIEDFFRFLFDVYIYDDADKKFFKYYVKRLSPEQKADALQFLDAALFYELCDNQETDQEEYNIFISNFQPDQVNPLVTPQQNPIGQVH